jgi:hypothetical protein
MISTQVSLDHVISQLKLTAISRSVALNIIAEHINEESGLAVYYDGEIQAAHSDLEPEEV